MNLLYLLPHNLVRFDDLWVAALLPELEFLIGFMSKLMELQLLQESFVFHFLHSIQDRPCGERFEFSNATSELWPRAIQCKWFSSMT